LFPLRGGLSCDTRLFAGKGAITGDVVSPVILSKNWGSSGERGPAACAAGCCCLASETGGQGRETAAASTGIGAEQHYANSAAN